jgi:hypothetical protein
MAAYRWLGWLFGYALCFFGVLLGQESGGMGYVAAARLVLSVGWLAAM